MAEEQKAEEKKELWDDLHPSTFREVPWYITSISVGGGRKANARPILNSNEQVVDDVGLAQRTYNVRGFIAARYKAPPDEGGRNKHKISQTYRDARKALLDALEKPDSAILFHPVEGEIRNLVAKSWTVDESITETGIGRIVVEFIRETTTPIPKKEASSKDETDQNAENAEGEIDGDVTDNLNADKGLPGVYESALEKGRSALTSLKKVAATVENLKGEVDAFQRDVASATALVASTIASPVAYADSIKNLVASLNSVFPTALAAFQGLKNGFDFGDLDLSFDTSTPSGKVKKKNLDTLNTQMRGYYLSSAIKAVVNIDFTTVDEIDRVEAVIEAQHRSIVDGDIASDAVKEGLEVLRESFYRFLDSARIAALKTADEHVSTTTPRILTHLLYGDDDLTDEIAAINGVQAHQLIGGKVKVLAR